MDDDQPDELDAVMKYIDEVLTEEYGPNHQEILAQGEIHSEFIW